MITLSPQPQQPPRQIDVTAAPPKLNRISTTFTTRCNLRCVYCPEGSHAEEWYADMSPEMLQHLVNYAREKQAFIDVSFYGDSTFHERFAEFGMTIINAGVGFAITSNMARLFKDEDIAVLARCRNISFSLDTQDRDAAKAIRKGLDVRTMVYNITRIRGYCLKNGIPIPPLTLHDVLNSESIFDLPNLVGFAAALGVNHFGCNELADLEGAKMGLMNVADMKGEELQRAIAAINEAIALAQKLNIGFFLSGEQAARINAASAGTLKESGNRVRHEGIQGGYTFNGDEVIELPAGTTRDCLEPWTGPIVNPNGNIYSCCMRGAVMGVVNDQTPITQAHNSQEFRELRLSLLTGEALNSECRRCPMAGQTTPAALQQKVAALYPSTT